MALLSTFKTFACLTGEGDAAGLGAGKRRLGGEAAAAGVGKRRLGVYLPRDTRPDGAREIAGVNAAGAGDVVELLETLP